MAYQLSTLADTIKFIVEPIRHSSLGSSQEDTLPAASFLSGESSRYVRLPLKEEASALLEEYVNGVDFIHPIVHIPSVRSLLKDLYTRLDQGVEVKSSHVALILSMFASTVYLWSVQENHGYDFTSVQDSTTMSIRWLKSALDTLDHSHRSNTASLEDIQATVILGFLIYNIEGWSAKCRSMFASALTLARELSLHKLDSPIQRRANGSAVDGPVDAEIKRRLWWHIAATDWWVQNLFR